MCLPLSPLFPRGLEAPGARARTLASLHARTAEAEEAALGYLLACYRFDRYRSNPAAKAALVGPEGVDTALLEHMAAGEYLTRDLINTPAGDLGPAELEAAARCVEINQ